jgi:hypothetical protein
MSCIKHTDHPNKGITNGNKRSRKVTYNHDTSETFPYGTSSGSNNFQNNQIMELMEINTQNHETNANTVYSICPYFLILSADLH